jgi:hypothetical protein
VPNAPPPMLPEDRKFRSRFQLLCFFIFLVVTKLVVQWFNGH